jgi:predicted MFS family arabinose efflux permease
MDTRSSVRALAALTFALTLSQFFRSCLAVMAPEVQADLQLSPAGFGLLSSCFFLSFGIAQIPVGMAFDRYGVGAPTRWLLSVGVVSAALFALAPNGPTAMLAQVGLGLACAPVFMGLMHFAADALPPHQFATSVSRANAAGMIGALCATAPLGWAIHAFGWRPAILVAGALMAVACYLVATLVKDSGNAQAQQEGTGAMLRASGRLLFIPALWTLIPMCMALAVGTTFRNSWGGPYLADVFGLPAGARGLALAVLSLAAISAAAALPWFVHRFSLRQTVLAWALAALAAGGALALLPGVGVLLDIPLLALLASIGVLHPLVMAHGRLLLAPEVRGRGLGLLNTFVFLGSAAAAWIFGLIADANLSSGAAPAAAYTRIFGFACTMVLVGIAAYMLSPSMARAAAAGAKPAA